MSSLVRKVECWGKYNPYQPIMGKHQGYIFKNRVGTTLCLIRGVMGFQVFTIDHGRGITVLAAKVVDIYNLYDFRDWFLKNVGRFMFFDPTMMLLEEIKKLGWVEFEYVSEEGEVFSNEPIEDPIIGCTGLNI